MNWSQTEAAANLGVSRVMYALYERGRRFEDDRPVAIPKAISLACQYYSRKCLTLEAVNVVKAWKACDRWPDSAAAINTIDKVVCKIESLTQT